MVQIFTAITHTPVLFFSTQGLAYKIKAHRIPRDCSSKGKSIFNILPCTSLYKFYYTLQRCPRENLKVIFVTQKGIFEKHSEDFRI